MAKSLPCIIGLHAFSFPPHRYPSQLWDDFDVECDRGCGARTTLTCVGRRDHWREKHDSIRPASGVGGSNG